MFVERWWRGDTFCGQCWLSSPCPQLSPRLIRPRWLASLELLWHLEGVIWSTGARERVCCFSGGTAAERKLYTHRVRETSVCLERWARLPLCVCLCGHVRERERERVAFPHGRLSLGIASAEKLAFLLSIRRELSLYFGPSHLQRKPQENATLEFLNTCSDQFLLAQTCRYNLLPFTVQHIFHSNH